MRNPDSDTDSSEEDANIYPLNLTYKQSFEIGQDRASLNFHLNNLFAGTTAEKVLGDIDIANVVEKKKKEKEKEKEKKVKH